MKLSTREWKLHFKQKEWPYLYDKEIINPKITTIELGFEFIKECTRNRARKITGN